MAKTPLSSIKKQLNAALFSIEAMASKIENILIVEDDYTLGALLKEILQGKHVNSVVVRTAEEALPILHNSRFECMVLDLMLPNMSGEELLEVIASDPTLEQPPLIIYSAKNLSLQERQNLSKYTNIFISKDGGEHVEAVIDSLIHNIEAHEEAEDLIDVDFSKFKDKKILVVDSDKDTVLALANLLKAKKMRVFTAQDSHAVINILEDNAGIDVMLINILMPVIDGYHLIEYIKRQEKFKKLSIVAMINQIMSEMHAKCIKAGATNFITKPIASQSLFAILQQIFDLEQQI